MAEAITKGERSYWQGFESPNILNYEVFSAGPLKGKPKDVLLNLGLVTVEDAERTKLRRFFIEEQGQLYQWEDYFAPKKLTYGDSVEVELVSDGVGEIDQMSLV